MPAREGTDLVPKASAEDHVRGSLDAPVVITEFADFECPFCGAAYPVLEAIRQKYGDRVAFVFRHYPLEMHPHALAAAEAAEAAASVGKFWEMYDQLYRHQAALENAKLRAYGEAIGVKGEAIVGAIERGKYRERIAKDERSGEESSIEGTPSFFINGFAYDNEASVAALSEAIDRVLARRPKP
jgi:protein-disulfide isomerase